MRGEVEGPSGGDGGQGEVFGVRHGWFFDLGSLIRAMMVAVLDVDLWTSERLTGYLTWGFHPL